MNQSPILILSLLSYCIYVQGLECGLADHIGDEHIQNAMKKCMVKDKEEIKDASDSSASSEETKPESYGARRSFIAKAKRSPKNDHQLKKRETESTDNEHEEENATISENCVLQCIFKELDMVNENGFPDHPKVAEALLKNVTGRELKDFLQDSTDECFQQIDKGDKLDACDYATQFTTCLAEKGRANCADWETTTLPFHS